MNPFPESAPLANLQFLRSYSRQIPNSRRKESWDQVCERTVGALARLGKYTREERNLVESMQKRLLALSSGRWLWVGGTPWLDRPENVYGGYNCSSIKVTDWDSFGLLMELAMMGCGTGAVLEEQFIQNLPPVRNLLVIEVSGRPGQTLPELRVDHSVIVRSQEFKGEVPTNMVNIRVGDSRQGWASSYQALLELATEEGWDGPILVTVDVSNVRATGEVLKGFGGVANPSKLPDLYKRVGSILNKAHGRRLTSVECCLLIDEAALVVVSGNIRRSAGMRQFAATDEIAGKAKENLWQQSADGSWRIDPERDALRMANHTRVFHEKPSREHCVEAVRKQFASGEGAIMWAGEAKRRANGDDRYGLNPCGEIIGADFLCNLSEVHLNQIDPADISTQENAFRAAALAAAALLNQKFPHERFQKSRDEDPIIGVSFTGAFTFFATLFGGEWLRWWQAGRPDEWFSEEREGNLATYFRETERWYFEHWRETVRETLRDYCARHRLTMPIRFTTVQPAGSKTLLTGVGACGWHPPKGKWYVRRMTFAKDHPVAKAALDYGYSVVPGQGDRDEEGRLLNDPFHPNCTEWLVEVPVQEAWATLPGVEGIEPERFPISAQWDFYMQVQKHYTTHNTSGTFEIFEDEIETLGELIHQAIENDDGYISCAVLARSRDNLTFPRLPFEPIAREVYEELMAAVSVRRKSDDFLALFHYHNGDKTERGPEDSACSGGLCEYKPFLENRKRAAAVAAARTAEASVG